MPSKHKNTTPGPRADNLQRQASDIRRGQPAKADNAAEAGFGLADLTLQPIHYYDSIGFNELDFIQDLSASPLYRSFAHYFKLCGARMPNIDMSSNARAIQQMYDALLKLVKRDNKGNELELAKNENGETYFLVYHVYNIGQTFVCLPLQFLDLLKKYDAGMYEVSLPLFCDLHDWGLSFFDDDDRIYYSMCIDSVDEMMTIYETGDDETDNLLMEHIIETKTAYSKKGQAVKIMRDIDKTKWTGTYNKQIERQKAPESLIAYKNWLLKGWGILQSDNRKCLLNLDCPDIYEYDADEAVELTRQFVFLWRTDDLAFHQFLESLNMDSGNFGSATPVLWQIISEESKAPFKYNSWFLDLFEWFCEGVEIIENFIKTQTTQLSWQTLQGI